MNVHPFAKVKRQAFSSSKKIYRKSTEGVDKREPSYTVGGDVNWYSRCGNTVWRFFKKLKIELLYDPTIPFLKKTLIQKDTCTPVIIVALFTIAKTWK